MEGWTTDILKEENVTELDFIYNQATAECNIINILKIGQLKNDSHQPKQVKFAASLTICLLYITRSSAERPRNASCHLKIWLIVDYTNR